MTTKVEKTISISVPPATVWEYLTEPVLMVKWMGAAELNIEVITSWVVGSPIVIKFFHHIKSQIKGTVLQFEPYRIIQYNHLDSISPLTDSPENYSTTTFLLTADEENTTLTVTVENFPMDTIYKHVNFYWQGTVAMLKMCVEEAE